MTTTLAQALGQINYTSDYTLPKYESPIYTPTALEEGKDWYSPEYDYNKINQLAQGLMTQPVRELKTATMDAINASKTSDGNINAEAKGRGEALEAYSSGLGDLQTSATASATDQYNLDYAGQVNESLANLETDNADIYARNEAADIANQTTYAAGLWASQKKYQDELDKRKASSALYASEMA